MSISRWVDKTTIGHLYNGILLCCKKKKKERERENFTLCNSVDGPAEHYAHWNKPVIEIQILCDITHMWNLTNWTNKQIRDTLIDGE